MSIILGRPFLNTAGAVIDCNKSKVTFHVNGNEHMVYFPKKTNKVNSLNSIENVTTITIGGFEFPLPVPENKYQTRFLGHSENFYFQDIFYCTENSKNRIIMAFLLY
jgi:hypothetical protein